jgi:phospholipid:diacylglycerol acyltransferase
MASSLRRRIIGGETPSDLREGTPEKAEKVRLAPVSKIHNPKHLKSNGHKRRHLFLFFLGGLAGIFAAGFFARSNDLIEFPEFGAMDSLLDVLPANVVKDARDLMVRFPLPFRNRI